MKKTLIAMAVLAASGASFAQATISGNLTMGYAAARVAGGDLSGLGTDTSQIDFTAVEDMGAGKKLTAKMSLAGADRSGEGSSTLTSGGGVSGRDASLTLATGVGTFGLGSVRSADYLSGGIAGVGAVYYTMDDMTVGLAGGLFSARSRRDTATYTLPTMAGFSFYISAQEGGNNQNLATGAAGAQSVQRITVYSGTYTGGALKANAQLLAYDQNGSGGADSTVKTVQRLSASYDFGVAKLGAGIQIQNNLGTVANASKATQTLVGVSAPVGALNLGVQWGQRKQEDYTTGTVAQNNSTRSGYSLAAVYSLSKRTAILAQYSRWDNANTIDTDSVTGVMLSHSF